MEHSDDVVEEQQPGRQNNEVVADHERMEVKVQRLDSFYVQAAGIDGSHKSKQELDWGSILKLAVQSIGVVYGDIGTSPLYVLPGIFPNGITRDEDIIGVLSLIFYSLIVIFMIKYVFVVLAANDNGDGGTFALYSLICRYAKASLIPNQQAEDREVSNYRLDVPGRRLKRASRVKSLLENTKFAKNCLLFVTLLGTSMVIGDGILTPCISVLSAVGGIKVAATSLSDTLVKWISVVILIVLFQVQRFGTRRVGYTFAPILVIWFISIAVIGIYNFAKYDPWVIKALNPVYIVKFFATNKKDAWVSMGGVLLCLTGAEALFADLGHFNIRSIQISSCFLVFPSVVLAYFGQASYLRKNHADVATAFYSSVPKPVYWPMFVVAVLASIIASQSLISAAFAIIKQSLALGCFPRVKVAHTSSKVEGQVYIPEINTLLMVACVAVTLGFKDTVKMGNAYGSAVASVFVITSSLLVIVMIMIWKTNIVLVILYVLTIGLLELVFLSSVFYKFVDGAYLPLLFSAVMVIIMFVWNYGYRMKYNYELANKVAPEQLVTCPNIRRVPGLAIFHTELVQGISPIILQYLSNIPVLHSVIVFVSIKSLPISKVSAHERFLFRRVEPRELAIYWCVVRYGYSDARMEHEDFEESLVSQLKEFILENVEAAGREEARSVDDAVESGGIVYLMGESEVMASKDSSPVKKVIVDYLFRWIKRFSRQQDEVFCIPRKQLLKVGITYEV